MKNAGREMKIDTHVFNDMGFNCMFDFMQNGYNDVGKISTEHLLKMATY